MGTMGAPLRQNLAARSCLTAPSRSRAARGQWVSPSLGQQAPPWGQAKARKGGGPVCGLGWWVPWLGCGELETGPSAESLGQELMAQGPDTGS